MYIGSLLYNVYIINVKYILDQVIKFLNYMLLEILMLNFNFYL